MPNNPLQNLKQYRLLDNPNGDFIVSCINKKTSCKMTSVMTECLTTLTQLYIRIIQGVYTQICELNFSLRNRFLMTQLSCRAVFCFFIYMQFFCIQIILLQFYFAVLFLGLLALTIGPLFFSHRCLTIYGGIMCSSAYVVNAYAPSISVVLIGTGILYGKYQ